MFTSYTVARTRSIFLYLILVGRIVNGSRYTMWIYCKHYCSDIYPRKPSSDGLRLGLEISLGPVCSTKPYLEMPCHDSRMLWRLSSSVCLSLWHYNADWEIDSGKRLVRLFEFNTRRPHIQIQILFPSKVPDIFIPMGCPRLYVLVCDDLFFHSRGSVLPCLNSADHRPLREISSFSVELGPSHFLPSFFIRCVEGRIILATGSCLGIFSLVILSLLRTGRINQLWEYILCVSGPRP